MLHNRKDKLITYNKKYYIKNKARISEQRREYRKTDKYKEYYQRIKPTIKRYKEDPVKSRERKEKWRKNHPEYFKTPKKRLDMAMCSLICISLKGKKSFRSWKSLVGYSIEELKDHIERQFTENMSWKNWGSYWELDHKIPKSWFKYESFNDKEFQECWSLKNLQPLEKIKNRKKNNKYAE